MDYCDWSSDVCSSDLPLVGRDRELRLIKELFHRAEETSRPSLLVVEGEAGGGSIGELQRRFLDAFQAAFRDETDAVNECIASHPEILQGAPTPFSSSCLRVIVVAF